MDRSLVLVDAGYLLREGEARRRRRRLRARGAAPGPTAEADSALTLLRTYWYDGAVDAVPTAEHLAIGMLPDVKLRLGRLTGSGQKGVDSLILRDLWTLARERAVSHAFPVTGDEDVREAVVMAQEQGVKVTVWGVGQGNQARTLRAEADRLANLDLSAYFAVAAGSSFAMAKSHAQPTHDSLDSIRATGREHGNQWLANATDDERADLLASRPVVPSTLDAELLRAGQAKHGTLRGAEEARRALRAGFWEAIDAG